MQTPVQPLPPHVQLFQMITGFTVSQAIFVAAKLNVAEHLAAGPLPVDQLAHKAGAHPEALYRLLRALASVGVFTETAPRRFANTPMSGCLRAGVPDSQRDELTDALRERYNRSGRGWITVTTLDGRRVLRITVMNARTNEAHVAKLVDGLVAEGRAVLAHAGY